MKVTFVDQGDMFKDPFRFLPYCTKCGAELSDGETPCRKCKEPLEWPEKQKPAQPSGQDEARDIAGREWDGAALPRPCAEKQAEAIRAYGEARFVHGRRDAAEAYCKIRCKKGRLNRECRELDGCEEYRTILGEVKG